MTYTAGLKTITEKYSYTQPGMVKKKRLNVAQSGKQGYLDVEYTYDTYGRVASIKYPDQSGTVTSTYTYAFDAMGRANKLTKSGSPAKDYVKDVLYGPAGEMT